MPLTYYTMLRRLLLLRLVLATAAPSSSSTFAASSSSPTSLFQWLAAHGCTRCGPDGPVRPHTPPPDSGPRGLFVVRPVALDAMLLDIPAACLLSIPGALSNPRIGAAILDSGLRLPDNVILALHLLDARNEGPRSFFAPYVASLEAAPPHQSLCCSDRELTAEDEALLCGVGRKTIPGRKSQPQPQSQLQSQSQVGPQSQSPPHLPTTTSLVTCPALVAVTKQRTELLRT